MSTWDLAAYPYVSESATTPLSERVERNIHEHYRRLRGHNPPTTEEIFAYWRVQDYQRSTSVAAPSPQSVALPLACHDWERVTAHQDECKCTTPPAGSSTPTFTAPSNSSASPWSDRDTGCYSPTLHDELQQDTLTTLSGTSARPPSPSRYKWLQRPSLPLSHPHIAALWPSRNGPTSRENERWLRTSNAFSQHGPLSLPLPTAESELGEQLDAIDHAQLLYDAPRLLGSLMEVLFEDSRPTLFNNGKPVVHHTVSGFFDYEEDTPVVPNLWCLENQKAFVLFQAQAALD